jgi:hypothetical protein
MDVIDKKCIIFYMKNGFRLVNTVMIEVSDAFEEECNLAYVKLSCVVTLNSHMYSLSPHQWF